MRHIVEMAAAIGAKRFSSTNLAIRRCFGEPLASSFNNYQSLQAVYLLPNAYRDHARRETHGQLGAQRTGASDSELVRTRKMSVGGPGSRHMKLLFLRGFLVLLKC